LLALGGHVSLYIPSVIDRKYTKSFFHHHHVPTEGVERVVAGMEMGPRARLLKTQN